MFRVIKEEWDEEPLRPPSTAGEDRNLLAAGLYDHGDKAAPALDGGRGSQRQAAFGVELRGDLLRPPSTAGEDRNEVPPLRLVVGGRQLRPPSTAGEDRNSFPALK